MRKLFVLLSILLMIGVVGNASAQGKRIDTYHINLKGDLVGLNTGLELYPILMKNSAGTTIFRVDSVGNVYQLGTSKILDDQDFSIGTTTTTAATKITAEFDETTTGIGLLSIGTLAVPQVLNTNPGETVVANTVNINHSAGAGNCADLIASYEKINVIGSGDADMTIVGTASRAYVGLTGGSNNSVASAAYGAQPWAKHEGTGAITAMSGLSAKLDVSADNFTASTVNAGHFHIEGAATVTGQFDGVMIEVYPDVTSMDDALKIAIDAGAAVNYGIGISGTPAISDIILSSGAKIFTGSAANGNAIYSEVGAKDATGSIYITTAGAIYIQVANAGQAQDWYKVTATDAD